MAETLPSSSGQLGQTRAEPAAQCAATRSCVRALRAGGLRTAAAPPQAIPRRRTFAGQPWASSSNRVHWIPPRGLRAKPRINRVLNRALNRAITEPQPSRNRATNGP
eukprot:scaffold49274_cov48-Phaeocystis_antarctica.AAC.2